MWFAWVGVLDAREKTAAEAVTVGEIHILTDWNAREPDEMETFIHLSPNLIVSRVQICDVTMCIYRCCCFYYILHSLVLSG